jgi:dihydroorotase
MEKLLIKNGNLVFFDRVEKSDLLIEGNTISKISKNITDDCKMINAEGLYVFPGLIDMHVHLREPGYEYKEDILSGSRAAIKGGFTQICPMPNTKPICDTAATVSYIKAREKEIDLVKINPIGAITVGEEGNQLAEIGKMKKAGIVAISDDGKPVCNSKIMRLAMEYANDFNLICLSHSEDKTLSEDGVVNEGLNSTLTGLKGIPRAAEEIMVSREILLAEMLKIPVHICHISTEGSVNLIKQAKERGVKVTAESCPHYFSLTDDVIRDFNPNTKVNPPLREERDRQAILEGYRNGIIDVIATDHAPHHKDEKNIEYNIAAFGISGLETSFSLTITNLYKKSILTLPQIAKVMSFNPAKILNLEGGEIKEGKIADIMLADIDKSYIIDTSKFLSKGKNSPFDKMKVSGEVQLTIINGVIKYTGEKFKK